MADYSDDPEGYWRHIAVSVAAHDGAFHGLTTPERDALERAMWEADMVPPRYDHINGYAARQGWTR